MFRANRMVGALHSGLDIAQHGIDAAKRQYPHTFVATPCHYGLMANPGSIQGQRSRPCQNAQSVDVLPDLFMVIGFLGQFAYLWRHKFIFQNDGFSPNGKRFIAQWVKKHMMNSLLNYGNSSETLISPDSLEP
jgi:hypothetical protein